MKSLFASLLLGLAVGAAFANGPALATTSGPLQLPSAAPKPSRAVRQTAVAARKKPPAPRTARAGRKVDFTPVGQTAGAAASGAAAAPGGPAEDEATKLARAYCGSLAQPALDARNRWAAFRMREVEGDLRRRIDELKERIAELRAWEEKRRAATKQAEENVVAIFTKMKPEAAAAQMSAMDEAIAAALLNRLNVRVASAILNEIAPEKAARLTAVMTGKSVRAGSPS